MWENNEEQSTRNDSTQLEFSEEGRRRKQTQFTVETSHAAATCHFISNFFVGSDKKEEKKKKKKKKTCSTALSNGTVAKDSSPIFGREIHGQTKKAEWEEGLVSWEGNLTNRGMCEK